MIVRPHPAGWRVSLHPAHGLLAAELYQHLAGTPDAAPGLPTLLAVADHDDHQLDFTESNYLTELGAPKDFTLLAPNDRQRSLQLERLLTTTYRKHLWTYLLIGKHYEFLYDGQPVDTHLKTTLKEIATQRKKILAARNEWSADLLERTYAGMRFCDRLSLLLYGDDVPTLGRAIEINDALGAPAMLCQEPKSGHLHVTPWPFMRKRFTVTVFPYVLPHLRFNSSEALGEAIASAIPEAQPVTFSAPASPP